MLQEEPLGTNEIARRLEVDKAGVSRVMAALQREGWVDRTGRRFVLGARTLALVDETTRSLLTESADVAGRLGRETGHTVAVLQRRGSGAQPLALHEAPGSADFREHPEPFEHLCATAGGIALLAQLPDETVDQYLDVQPWPLASPMAPSGPEAIRELVAQVRAGSAITERSWTVPGQACIALPWSGHARPLAVAVLGPESALTRHHDEMVDRIRTALER